MRRVMGELSVPMQGRKETDTIHGALSAVSLWKLKIL